MPVLQIILIFGVGKGQIYFQYDFFQNLSFLSMYVALEAE